jgi:hypothetical protein
MIGVVDKAPDDPPARENVRIVADRRPFAVENFDALRALVTPALDDRSHFSAGVREHAPDELDLAPLRLNGRGGAVIGDGPSLEGNHSPGCGHPYADEDAGDD